MSHSRGWIARLTGARDAARRSDPVAEAVAAGVQHGAPGGAAPPAALRDAGQALKEDGAAAILTLLDLVRRHPGDETLQRHAARALEQAGRMSESRAALKGIVARFPDRHDALRQLIRVTRRDAGPEAALALLRDRFARGWVDPGEACAHARALIDLDRLAEARDVFERAIHLFPYSERLWLDSAAALREAGLVLRARERLDEAIDSLGPLADLVDGRERLAATLSLIENEAPAALRGDNVFLGVLDHAITRAETHAPAILRPARTILGPVAMVTSSLGAGGAERQFVATAAALQKAAAGHGRIGGADILGPVRAVCRALDPRGGRDFFLRDLRAAGVEVASVRDMRDFGGRPRGSAIGDLARLIDLLPQATREGVLRLTDHFRASLPDVVHIWQDGMILAAALPALLAGAPRVVLSVRTVPPVDRPDRHRPEYQTAYAALLRSPRVVATANSAFAARRYAEWLAVDPGLFRIIHNGATPLPPAPLGDAAAQFAAFAHRAPARFTLGGVMRLDSNKRPLLWLDIAAALLARGVDARFILVGDGPMGEAARAHAGALGVAERTLFTGRSECGGYWLSRMDAMLLTSRHEGLPNVLIEAQLAGVPVVTTPAGGAPEALLPGETGFLLGEPPDPKEAAELIDTKLGPREARAAIGSAGRAFATRNFSMEAMIEDTVRAYLVEA